MTIKSTWLKGPKGRWAGGRVSEKAGGTRTYWIERMVRGTRRVIGLMGLTEAEAGQELLLYRADPVNYQPPAVRAALAKADADAEATAAAAGQVILTAEKIEACIEAMKAGYGSRKAVSDHHAFVTHSCLSDWATSVALHGKDLAKVELSELHAGLDEWEGSHKHRIVALRSFTAWLRWRGDLKRGEDPTLDLAVPQARRPTPAERAEKVYTVEQLEKTYRHISNQAVRDIFRVRVHSGLHETEIARIAAGECVIRKVVRMGKIAATIDVTHKSGNVHRQSVDAATLAAIERLAALNGRWPTEKTLARHRKKAAALSKQPELFIGNIRHTRTTLATEIGDIVYAKKKAGVPLELVARSHGHDPGTAAAHYLGTEIPPLVVIPVKLNHPGDPPQPSKRRR